MQMYKGLPIITNKVPERERHGVPHHLLDFIGLEEKPWTVQHFVRESSRVIDEIRSRGKLPVVVGGTIYYTFSLLFKDATLTKPDYEAGSAEDQGETREEDFPILSAPTDEILRKLQDVDPEMAKRWHPNDRNKIRRSLQIWLQTGRRASDIYAEQRQLTESIRTDEANSSGSTEGDTLGPGGVSLRYPTLLLWLEADDAILKQRLNDRVNTMVADGLCDEVLEMAALEKDLKQKADPVDLAKGIWASIGYKEMQHWMEAKQASNVDPARMAHLRQEAIESVQASTRRYAKRQNRFVRIRLARALESAGKLDTLFLLDCTAPEQWSSAVREPAEGLVNAFLSSNELPNPKTLSEMANKMLLKAENHTLENDDREARFCDVCNKTLMTEKEWKGHLASRSHKKTVAWQRKRQSIPSEEIDGGRDMSLASPLE